MKRISVVMAVCLCLMVVSCNKGRHSEKKIYVSIEGTVDGISFSREINSRATTFHPHREYDFNQGFYGLDSIYLEWGGLDTLCARFLCEIRGNNVDKERDIDFLLHIKSKDTTCFRNGKRYYYDKSELKNQYTDSLWRDKERWRWLRAVENQFSLQGIQDLTTFKENYEQGWFQFDIIEKDGVRFSLTFECKSHVENDIPHIVAGKLLFYDYDSSRLYKDFIK